MPTGRPAYAYLDGAIVLFGEARLPLDDRGLQFGESLYEVIAITAGKPRLLEEHVTRMRTAALELGLGAGVPTQEAWERMVSSLVAREGAPESMMYAQVTGGSSPRRHVPLGTPRPTFFAYVTPHRFPRADDVARGIAAVAFSDTRWRRCDLKTTMLLPAVLAKREAARRGAHEALLFGADGELNEGASSNVYIVEDRALVSPAPSCRILPGTTRSLVESVAAEAGLGVTAGAIDRERLLAASEVFITSTTQLVMPVVAIDGVPIAAGVGGPVATDLAVRIRRRYELV